MKHLYLHWVNIHAVYAEKELVWTQCIAAFAGTRCTKNAVVWREDSVKYPILNATKTCSLRQMIHIGSKCWIWNCGAVLLSIRHAESSDEAEASSMTRVRTGENFRELLPPLTSTVFSHKSKGKTYEAGVRSAMLYGSSLDKMLAGVLHTPLAFSVKTDPSKSLLYKSIKMWVNIY